MEHDFIYLRVSKEDETKQDIDSQLPPIIEKFNINIKECRVIKDRGSAYDISKLHNRSGLLEIIEIITNEIRVIDFFLGKIKREEKKIYIFDYNRLFRNIEFGLLFSIMCVLLNVKVYSVNQEDLNPKDNENIGEKIGRYIRLAMYSFLAEGYSKNISDHTKKAFIKKGLTSYSKEGNKVGRRFRDNNNNEIELSAKKIGEMEQYILSLIKFYSYSYVVTKVLGKYNVRLSQSYISKLKQKNLNSI